MIIPEVDLESMKKRKEQNFQERLKFIELYVAWLKKTPNEKWSSQQKEIINQ